MLQSIQTTIQTLNTKYLNKYRVTEGLSDGIFQMLSQIKLTLVSNLNPDQNLARHFYPRSYSDVISIAILAVNNIFMLQIIKSQFGTLGKQSFDDIFVCRQNYKIHKKLLLFVRLFRTRLSIICLANTLFFYDFGTL